MTIETTLDIDTPVDVSPNQQDPARHYMELLKRTLLNWYFSETVVQDMPQWSWSRKILAGFLKHYGIRPCVPDPIPIDQLTDGKGMHTGAYTLVGLKRLDNVQQCIEGVLRDNIPGDLLEAGVWRGGTCIFMRGVLKAYGVTNRTVWVADSFQGLPEPNPEKYPEDSGEWMHNASELAISRSNVQANFERFDMFDQQVKFVEGFFSESLPTAPIERLAVLRLDGDMYESTIDTLNALYPKLSPGGYLIVDDYRRDNCRKAVADYREQHHVNDPIVKVDWTCSYWQKTG